MQYSFSSGLLCCTVTHSLCNAPKVDGRAQYCVLSASTDILLHPHLHEDPCWEFGFGFGVDWVIHTHRKATSKGFNTKQTKVRLLSTVHIAKYGIETTIVIAVNNTSQHRLTVPLVEEYGWWAPFAYARMCANVLWPLVWLRLSTFYMRMQMLTVLRRLLKSIHYHNWSRSQLTITDSDSDSDSYFRPVLRFWRIFGPNWVVLADGPLISALSVAKVLYFCFLRLLLGRRLFGGVSLEDQSPLISQYCLIFTPWFLMRSIRYCKNCWVRSFYKLPSKAPSFRYLLCNSYHQYHDPTSKLCLLLIRNYWEMSSWLILADLFSHSDLQSIRRRPERILPIFHTPADLIWSTRRKSHGRKTSHGVHNRRSAAWERKRGEAKPEETGNR